MISAVSAFLFFAAVFLLSIMRPKTGILLPIILHSAYLIRLRIFGYPTTGLEVILLSSVLGVIINTLVTHAPPRSASRETALRSIRPGVVFEQTRWGLNLVKVFLKRDSLVLLFILSATLSAFIAPHPLTSWGIWKSLVIEPIVYVIILRKVLDKEINSIIPALILGGWIVVVASLYTPWFGDNFYRFRGIYDVPNSLALVMAPLFVVAFYYGLVSRKRRIFYMFSAVVFGTVLTTTQSLSGLIAVIIVLLFKIRKKTNFGLILVPSLVIIALSVQLFTGKLTHLIDKESSSLIARLQIWETSINLIRDNPVLGTGLGTFEPAYQEKLRFQPPVTGGRVLEWVVRDPHNLFFSFWLNTGLLGLFSVLGLIGLRFSKFHWTLDPKTAESDNEKNTRDVFRLVLLTLIIFGLFDVPYWKNDLALFWWVYLLY